jgi:uncharacterized paraquat-inducible protein A
MEWQRKRLLCEYCDPDAELKIIKDYERAVCTKCGTDHGYNEDDDMWFGL